MVQGPNQPEFCLSDAQQGQAGKRRARQFESAPSIRIQELGDTLVPLAGLDCAPILFPPGQLDLGAHLLPRFADVLPAKA
jgi:hypothetical protein